MGQRFGAATVPGAHVADRPVPAPTLSDTTSAMRQLAAVQRVARTNSPAVLAARARRDAVRSRAAATGFVGPVTLTAGLSEAPNGDPTQGNLRLEFGRELFAARRNGATRDVAAASAAMAETEVRAAEREVDALVLRETVRAGAWRAIADRLAAEEQLLSGADENVRSRFAVGAARYVDVLRVRTERIRVQTERAAALSEIRAGRAALVGLLGAGGVQAGALLDSLAQPSTTAGAGGPIAMWHDLIMMRVSLDSILVASRDVAAADGAVRQARAEQALGIAQRRAQVTAYAGVQRIGQANNGPAFGPSLGFTTTLPFTSSRPNALVAQADAQSVASAEESRRAVTSAARTRLLVARERLDAARERLSVFDAALLQGAREERESALASFRSGGITLLDFIDFERTLARAEIDRVHALLDAADALADLLSGNGSGPSSPVQAPMVPSQP